MLVATYSNASLQSGKGSVGGKSSNHEVEKGLLTLIASDNPGIQVILCSCMLFVCNFLGVLAIHYFNFWYKLFIQLVSQVRNTICISFLMIMRVLCFFMILIFLQIVSCRFFL